MAVVAEATKEGQQCEEFLSTIDLLDLHHVHFFVAITVPRVCTIQVSWIFHIGLFFVTTFLRFCYNSTIIFATGLQRDLWRGSVFFI
jgi:hypothetical protein